MVIIVVSVIVLFIALYIEWKYMRPRREDEIELVLDRDEAYNAISSGNAVASSLRGMGKDTREAEVMLAKAQLEYDMKDFGRAIATAKVARQTLMSSKDIDPFEMKPEQETSEERLFAARPEGVKEEPSVHEAKKLPPNYLESKFMIATIRDEIAQVEGKKDVAEAIRQADEAQRLFDNAQYTEALGSCLKARKALGGGDPIRRSDAMVQEKGVMRGLVERVDLGEKKPVIPCTQCGEPLVEGDNFCGKCGQPVTPNTFCPKCKALVGAEDSFCRRCGASVR